MDPVDRTPPGRTMDPAMVPATVGRKTRRSDTTWTDSTGAKEERDGEPVLWIGTARSTIWNHSPSLFLGRGIQTSEYFKWFKFLIWFKCASFDSNLYFWFKLDWFDSISCYIFVEYIQIAIDHVHRRLLRRWNRRPNSNFWAVGIDSNQWVFQMNQIFDLIQMCLFWFKLIFLIQIRLIWFNFLLYICRIYTDMI